MRLAAAVLAIFLSASAEAPKVHIRAPRGGWTSQRVVRIAGAVSDRSLRSVQLSLNGATRTIAARSGQFEARLPARPGPNRAEVSAQAVAGIGRDQVTFFAAVPPADLQILLTWDADGTDLDLHVTEPGGEVCYYGNRRTAAGGALEVDARDGFGPEVYLLPRAPLGEYRVAVACYGARGAAHVEARVEVVLREGTASERRTVFPATLTHEGETVEVGTFLVDSPLQ